MAKIGFKQVRKILCATAIVLVTWSSTESLHALGATRAKEAFWGIALNGYGSIGSLDRSDFSKFQKEKPNSQSIGGQLGYGYTLSRDWFTILSVAVLLDYNQLEAGTFGPVDNLGGAVKLTFLNLLFEFGYQSSLGDISNGNIFTSGLGLEVPLYIGNSYMLSLAASGQFKLFGTDSSTTFHQMKVAVVNHIRL